MENLFCEIAAERTAAEKAARALESSEQREARQLEREAKKATQKEARLRAASVAAGGLHFGDSAASRKAKKKSAKQPRVALKNDPKLVAAARELRDRWLEKATAEPGLIEAGAGVAGKYEVSRQVEQVAEQRHGNFRCLKVKKLEASGESDPPDSILPAA